MRHAGKFGVIGLEFPDHRVSRDIAVANDPQHRLFVGLGQNRPGVCRVLIQGYRRCAAEDCG